MAEAAINLISPTRVGSAQESLWGMPRNAAHLNVMQQRRVGPCITTDRMLPSGRTMQVRGRKTSISLGKIRIRNPAPREDREGGLAQPCITPAEVAPPFAVFKGWVPRSSKILRRVAQVSS